MTDPDPREWVKRDEAPKLLPGKGFALAPAVEAPEQEACSAPEERVDGVRVEGDRVVPDVALHLGAEHTPQLRQRKDIRHPPSPVW